MSVVAAAVLAVPAVLLCLVGAIWLRAPARTVHGVLAWAATHTGKDPTPPPGAATVARGFGAVLLLAGLLLLARAALLL